MDDTLGFKAEDKKSSTTEWPLDDGDDISKLPKISLNQQHLQVISKNEMPSKWPVIPATFMEKLSFYRAYTSSASKIEILSEQQNNVKRFFWFYVFNVLCKSLPMTYIYLFLSSYSPDHPLFLSKMVPLFYGYNFIFLITGFLGLALLAHDISIYIAYFLLGIIYKIPWNRCIEKYVKTPDEHTCLNLGEFAQRVNSQNITFSESYYYNNDTSEYFNLAQIEFFSGYLELYYKRAKFNKEGIHLMILSSIWITAFCLRNHISKRYIWQILHHTQLLLCGLYILSFLHLLVTYEDKTITYIKPEVTKNRILMIADFDLLAESMTAPPVAYIISSRSLEEVYFRKGDSTSIFAFNVFVSLIQFDCSVHHQLYLKKHSKINRNSST